MKAIANTNIRLGLVNLPVQVMQAIETARDVTFKQAGPNGESLKQHYATDDGTIVPRDQMQKGIFVGEEFFPISSSELAAIDEATKLPELHIEEVVPADEFWTRAHRITGLYYLQSAVKNGNVNAFKLFVDTLEEEGLVMVTKWTARSRQKQMVVWAKDGLLMANSLCFARDVREPDTQVRAHLSGQYSDQEKDMARQLLSALTVDSSNALEMDVDDAVAMKQVLVEDALAGRGVEVPATPEQPQQNAALADALAASLAAIGAQEKVA